MKSDCSSVRRGLPIRSKLQPIATALLAVLTLSAGHRAFANPEMDRNYALTSVGVLRSWDNVDGLFADYVTTAYKEYFLKQSRFVYMDLSRVDTLISSSKIDYDKIIADPDILAAAARALHAETLVRTKIYKEGTRYRFTLDWLHAPKMEILSTETFMIDQPNGGRALGFEDLRAALQSALGRMIKQVPFLGMVTGRDRDSATLDIGKSSGLQVGDLVRISTLEEVKRHPLLGTIAEWSMAPVGKAVVETLDDGIAFCKILEEEQIRPIARYQKVVALTAAKAPEPEVEDLKADEIREAEEPPRLGWAAAGLNLGSYSRQFTSGPGTGRTGSGFLYGADVLGQLWLTKAFFTELGFGYGSANYSQADISTQLPTASGKVNFSMFKFQLDVGYTYFTSGTLSGPKAWAKLGYQSVSYSLPLNPGDDLASSANNGLFLGVGGDLPLANEFGGILELDFGIINGADATALTSTPVSGSSYVNFYFGGYYQFAPKMMARFGLGILNNGTDFTDGTGLSQKVISAGPSIVYYF